MANKKITTKSTRTMGVRNTSRKAADNISDNRDRVFIGLIALLAVALVGTVGVAVAAMSQDLKIQGTATVKQLNWDVHFDNLKPVITNNSAKETSTPTIDTAKTTISNYKVEFQHPDDSATYEFDVVNDGDVDAKVTAIAMAGQSGLQMTCTSTVGTSNEISTRNTETCKRLDYTLTYKDGTPVAVNDTLMAGAKKTMKLKLEFARASDGTSYYPDDDVEISGLGVTVTYGQN